jgi:hypothetical protein
VIQGGVAGDQVQKDPDVPPVGLVKNALEVLVGAVAGGGPVVVGDVVPRVSEGGGEAGVDPQSVAPQVPDVVQFFQDAGKVANAVGIGVAEGLGVNFIEDCVVQPFWHSGGLLISAFQQLLTRPSGAGVLFCRQHTTLSGKKQ